MTEPPDDVPRPEFRPWKGEVDWPQFFECNGSPGGVDVLCAGPHTPIVRAAELIFAAIAGLSDKAGNPFYRRVTVLVPPGAEPQWATLLSELAFAAERIRKASLSALERDILQRITEVTPVPTLKASALVEVITELQPRSLVLVPNAGLFRADIEQTDAPRKPFLQEDRWVPHLHALAASCATAVLTSESCVILDVGFCLPVRERNRALLMDAAGSLSGREATLSETSQEFGRWFAMSRSGDANDVLNAIDELPSSFDPYKTYLKFDALHEAGRDVDAVALAKDHLKTNPPPEAELALHLARVADAAGDEVFVQHLIHNALPGLRSATSLGSALLLSQRWPPSSLSAECAKRLHEVDPESSALTAYWSLQLLSLCRTSSDISPTEDLVAAFPGFAVALLTAFKDDTSRITSADTLATAFPEHADLARLCCAVHAIALGDHVAAGSLALPTPRRSFLVAVRRDLLLETLELLLIAARDESLKDSAPPIVRALLQHLASHPTDNSTRNRLLHHLSMRVAGFSGIALLAHAAIGAFRERSVKDDERRAELPQLDAKQFIADIRPIFEWIGRDGLIVLSEAELPEGIIKKPPEHLLSHLQLLLDYEIRRATTAADLTQFQIYLAAACAVARHANANHQDIDILRSIGATLATLGNRQVARNYAQQALDLAKREPVRARRAWFAFSDLFHHCGNEHESLLALAVAFSVPIAITQTMAYEEVTLLFRLLRDIGLISEAEDALHIRDELVAVWGEIPKHYGSRTTTDRLGLRLAALARETLEDDQLRRFCEDALTTLRQVLDGRDELGPITALAGNVRRLCQERGLDIPRDFDAFFTQALQTLGGDRAEFIRIATSQHVVGADLVRLVARASTARYADDTAYDIHPIANAARRALSQLEVLDDAAAVYAAELTADQSISHSSGAPALPGDLNEPLESLRRISRLGASISLLSVSSNDRLINVSANAGLVARSTDDTTFFAEPDFLGWRERFPYDFHLAANPNVIYLAMEGLSVALPDATRHVFIPATYAHCLPPTLIMQANDFVGRTKAVATAPSIRWLTQAIDKPRRPTEASHAWIPAEAMAGDLQLNTLQIVASRLELTLAEHRIEMSRSVAPSPRLRNAQLAIVCAHGGLDEGNRHFRIVADESGHRTAAITLAQALADAGVAVLFICSGGRFDVNPFAHTTIALPRELLSRGCAAVIASPWPLNGSVPGHFLPTFLDHWHDGDMVIDATFAANRAVAAALGGDPRDCLAMTVYGNPFISRAALAPIPR